MKMKKYEKKMKMKNHSYDIEYRIKVGGNLN